MLTVHLIPSVPPYTIFKTFEVDTNDVYEVYKYIDTKELLYRHDYGEYSILGKDYKDYYVLEYDTFFAIVPIKEETTMETGYKIVCNNCTSDRINHYVDEDGKDIFICRDCNTTMDLEHVSIEEILIDS